MAESTARIESIHSRREPEPQTPRSLKREKARPKPTPVSTPEEAPAEVDEQEKHELDTLA
jgi:hypothetical protein